MTRAEAYDKLPIMEQGITRNHFLNALEALGLIKFEEEKKIIDSPSMVIKNQLEPYTFQPMLKADKIVNALMQAGYKIVRLGG